MSGGETVYVSAQASTLALRKYLTDSHISGFGHTYACKDVMSSIAVVAQASGMGSLRSNTVTLCWPQSWNTEQYDTKADSYVHMLRDIVACKKSILVIKGVSFFPLSDETRKGYIDIWWILHDGGMLMLVCFVVSKSNL